MIEAKYFDSILELMCPYWKVRFIWLRYLGVQRAHFVLLSFWYLGYNFVRGVYEVVQVFETGTSI